MQNTATLLNRQDFDVIPSSLNQEEREIWNQLFNVQNIQSSIRDQQNWCRELNIGQNFNEDQAIISINQLNGEVQTVQRLLQQKYSQCNNSCALNLKVVKKQIELSLQKKYESQFTFYFSKPINELLSNYPTHHVVLFKEYLFIDDENEYLKRFYFSNEHSQRLNQLLTFYQEVFPPFSPNLYALDIASIMIKRNNAQDKIFFIENERKLRQPPETQREQISPAQEDLYLESQSSIVGNQQQSQQNNEDNYKNNELDDQNIMNLNMGDIENQNQNFIFDKDSEYIKNNKHQYELFSNQHAIEYYNDDIEGINRYAQQKNNKNQQMQEFKVIPQKKFQKLRTFEGEQIKQNQEKNTPMGYLDQEINENLELRLNKGIADTQTPKKDQLCNSNQIQKDNPRNKREDRKKVHINQDQISPREYIQGVDYNTPRDDLKINPSKCNENIGFQENVREAFIFAIQNSQKRNKEQQRREWDAQNRYLNKNNINQEDNIHNPIESHNKVKYEQNNNFYQFGDEDVEEVYNILHTQDQRNQQIHNQPFKRKSTELDFDEEFGAYKDFSLNTQELMDESDSNQEQIKDFQGDKNNFRNFMNENKNQNPFSKKQESLHQQDIQINKTENDEDDESSNIQMFSDFKKKNNYSGSQQRDDHQEDDNDDLHGQNENNQNDDFFGEGSFMKDLNNYEMEISYETTTYDVFNPSFSSQQDESYSRQFYKQEEKLFQEILDVQDYEDIMERYAIGQDEVCNFCKCSEFAKNKENINKNTILSDFEKQSQINRQNPNDEKGILKQQNVQASKNSDNSETLVKQISSTNEISQIKKGNSTSSLQQAKNHSNTPSNQNNYPSTSSMKSSHHYQQQPQQPEEYQIIQQYLQQQISQQQQNLLQNHKQDHKSTLKQQHSQEMNKYGKDLSPRNLPFLLDLNDLNPNIQNINQNFNEILQAQIQNQIMIKQRLEQSNKTDNSNSNKLIEQNQQYYTNHSSNKLENNIQLQQQNQQFQQIHNSASQNALNNVQQSRNNNHNSSNSIPNQKINIQGNNNSIASNNNLINNVSNHISLNATNTNPPPTNQKPVYNNTKKKLANQLQAQNHTASSSLLNAPQASNNQNNIQEKNQRLIEILTSNGQQNISQSNYIPNSGSDVSQAALMASIAKQGQNTAELGLGARSKFFDQNQTINLKKSENSSTYNTLDSTKKPIASFIEQSQASQSVVHQTQTQQNQPSKLKSNPSNNNASQLSYNQVQSPIQMQQGQYPHLINNVISQQANQNKINTLLNSQAKNPNSSTSNLKNNQTKNNTSSQQQLEILTLNQQSQLGMEKSLQLKAYNQLSQHLNNQNKAEKNIASLAASTSSSQKGFNNSQQQQYHQITQQNNQISKVRDKMHGKEKRNTSINQSNPGSISLSNIKKQSFLNQFDTPQQQINKQMKYNNSQIQSDNQQQQEILQYYQSPLDSTQQHKQQQENIQFKIEKKSDQQTILSSPQDKISQQFQNQQQQQQAFQPQKRSSENKIQPQNQNGIRFTNKSISHSQNLYQKDEGVRASMNSQINTVNPNSQKKNQEIGVANSTSDINCNPILMKQGSKDSIGQKALEINNNKPNISNQAQNPLTKSSALNIEVQRRISLKHLKIKENSHFIGVNKNNSIEKEPSSVTQVQQRWNETNLTKKQNSIKQNQKRFPHLNNSVGDPSPIKKKDDISNVQSVLDSHREIQYSNNSHHNQIVTSLLSLHQVNPQIEQIMKKPSLNFLPQTKTNSNQQNNHHQIESASKLAIGIYQQNIHKTTLGSQSTAVINSLPTNNSYNHSRTYNINNPIGLTGISQSNSRMNSQEKVFTRPNKNKSVDENTRKKKIVQQQYQQNNVMQSQNSNQQIRQQQSPSSSLPHQQQKYYYPSSISTQITQVPQNFVPQFMSPQHNNSFTPINQMQQTYSNTNQNKNSIDNSLSPIINEQQQAPYMQPLKQFNFDECITNTKIQNPLYQQNNSQQKSRIKQNNILFASQISQSLQQSQNSMHQYKNSTPQQQIISEDHQIIDNQISSPRFKKIQAKKQIQNIQIEQNNQIQNQIQNGSNSQSSTPSQSQIANQQLQQQQNIQPEKEKINQVNQGKNIKGFQKKQLLHHSNSTNINNIKKNNFMKEKEAVRVSQQQHTSLGDGVSQNSSYGFLTSRSVKKSQKESQATQKINVQESPYNIDAIKRENKQQSQQAQQQIQNPILSQQQQQQFANQQNCIQLGNKFFIVNN